MHNLLSVHLEDERDNLLKTLSQRRSDTRIEVNLGHMTEISDILLEKFVVNTLDMRHLHIDRANGGSIVFSLEEIETLSLLHHVHTDVVHTISMKETGGNREGGLGISGKNDTRGPLCKIVCVFIDRGRTSGVVKERTNIIIENGLHTLSGRGNTTLEDNRITDNLDVTRNVLMILDNSLSDIVLLGFQRSSIIVNFRVLLTRAIINSTIGVLNSNALWKENVNEMRKIMKINRYNGYI